ncbi:protein serine/threonine phosphatase 2C [Exidia glandulosa HHB12029]|uniref:Protein serine/threonine phosphatase 2C n=1 Tax=Exidia glandulosa HHB12029 TaxID=1314781 RepID=A0A166A3M4_EXIGL|nr:protein serine/threonine phosphatase 2C [Exidia glandulosa HHB12029]
MLRPELQIGRPPNYLPWPPTDRLLKRHVSSVKVQWLDFQRNVYDREPAFPTRVDASTGVRYFLDFSNKYNNVDAGDIILCPRFRLLPRQEMQDVLAMKKSAGVLNVNGLSVSHVTMQAIKESNEDRLFVHPFEHGTLFGILDGHGGSECSQKASRELPGVIAQFLTSALGRAGHTALTDTARCVEDAISAAIKEFDAALITGLEDTVAEFTALYPGDFDMWDIKDFMRKEMREGQNRPANALAGCTALIGFIPTSNKTLFVASLGDSQAGMYSDAWDCTTLNEFHAASNPHEVARLQAEHPGEEGIVRYNRLFGAISVTRALGDHLLKAPIELSAKYYCYAHPMMVPPGEVKQWPGKYKTPPYMSVQPSFQRIGLVPGDVIVFASDGLRNTWQTRALTASEQEQLFVGLCGYAGRLDNPVQDLGRWETKLGHRFLPMDQEEVNAADWMLMNVLFGGDDVKLARELTIEFPEGGSERWQDDITVISIHV